MMKRTILLLVWLLGANVFGRQPQGATPAELAQDVAFLKAEHERQNAVAAAIQRSLAEATTIELLAIEPYYDSEEAEKNDTRPKILQWPIIKTATLKDRAAIKDLGSALADGIRASEVGSVPGCFNPRHALRWRVDGKEMILVVCFECGNGGVVGPEGKKGFLTTKSPERGFDRIFSAAGLPKAK